MSKTLSDFRLSELLPPNLSALDESKAISSTEFAGRKLILDNIPKAYIDIDTAPDWVLALLAWERHVDFYDAELPVEVRRTLIRNAFKWHLYKGTPEAIEDLIAAVFGVGKVREWFEYGGEPHHFRIESSPEVRSKENLFYFLRVLSSIKRFSSWLDEIRMIEKDEVSLYLGTAGMQYTRKRGKLMRENIAASVFYGSRMTNTYTRKREGTN